jgi:hypothetical protein
MRNLIPYLFGVGIVSTMATEARAENPQVTAEYIAEAGTYNNLDYVFVEGFMTGTIAREGGGTGNYKVPVAMYYPKTGGNSSAIVELTNSGFFIFTRDATGNLVACGRGDEFTTCDDNNFRVLEKLLINFVPVATESYLWRNGYAYMAVQWNKMVTDQMGAEPPDGLIRRRSAYGTIEVSTDAFEITRDAARWMRTPTAYAGGAPALAAQTKLISFGYSNGAAVQRSLLGQDGNREEDLSLIYDAFLLYAIGAPCWIFDDTAPVFGNFNPCPGSPATNGAKILSVDTQSDMEVLGGAFARDFNLGTPEADPNFVRWELAGVAHIPPLGIDMAYKGTTRSNPVDVFPVVRSAFFHLNNWVVANTNPPPTIHLDGTVDAMGNWMTAVDADANPTGGVRLPHLFAPTGVYGGIDFAQLPMYFLNSLGGQYVRFEDAVLTARYPTEQAYRTLYNGGADTVLGLGYILPEDHAKYIATPDPIPDPPPPPPDDEEPAPPSDSGCSTGGSGGTFASLIGVAFIMGMLRRRARRLAVASTLVAAAATGCDDGDSPPPGECIGHTCPDATIDLPEGGEVRLELVYIENRAPEIRTYAWFASAQDPETRPWPRHPSEWGIQDGANLCTDLRTGVFFPSSPAPTRTYMDGGTSVEFVGPTTITLDKKEATRDLVFDIEHDIIYMGEPDPALVVPGGTYDFEIAGGSDLEAQLVEGAIHVPADTRLTFPDTTEHILFPRGQDFRFLWDSDSTDPFDFAFVAFSDLYGPIGFCIGPQSGYMTIPESFIAQMPQAGIILHGLVNHNAVERSDGRKFDFLGINCRQNSYVVDSGI